MRGFGMKIWISSFIWGAWQQEALKFPPGICLELCLPPTLVARGSYGFQTWEGLLDNLPSCISNTTGEMTTKTMPSPVNTTFLGWLSCYLTPNTRESRKESVLEVAYSPVTQVKLNILLLQISWKYMINEQRPEPLLGHCMGPIYCSLSCFSLTFSVLCFTPCLYSVGTHFKPFLS